jgi:protein SCO1
MTFFSSLMLGVIFLLTMGAASPQMKSPAELVKEIGIDQKLNSQLPLDLVFKNEAGETVKLRDYFGKNKPIILTLVYFRCPMLCSMVLNGLVAGIRPLHFQLGKEYEILTISFDPTDTPEEAQKQKNKYEQLYLRPGVQEGWHFLTGDKASVDAITKAVGFRYVPDPHGKQFAHASGIIIATPEGKLSKYFYGIDYSTNDLRLSLVEASQGKIGSVIDQLLLLCFHYDPSTGKYGFAIIAALRVLALTVVTVLAFYIGTMLYREKHNTLQK